ncbi:MAG: GAF domain-containing protein [Ferruginibacter sp.]
MQEPLPSKDEISRIENLHYYEILDSPREKIFDDIASLAAQVCNCQYALISFIDKDRQWFKATEGVELTETPRHTSICGYTILQDNIMVIKDTNKDSRFYDNPIVTGEYQITFYATANITSAEGYNLGTICVMDKKPKRGFSEKQKNVLRVLSGQISTLLKLGIVNRILIKDADALVEQEKKIVQQTLTEQEEEKNFIANELHENFAQTLAATKLYLDFAERSKELSSLFIKKCKDNILHIIRDLKSLSKSMLPSTYENSNYLGFIQEMLQEYGKQNEKEINFQHKGKLDCYDSSIGLTLFRIIQYQLKIAHNCGAKKINITIKTDEIIKVVFLDDGKNADAEEPERKMLLHHIETRIGLVKGKVVTGVDKNNNNKLEIEIPLVQ